jgi:hypothetical protein|tara:strand:- start:470 stop:649 length:180 start_codon:yes stop_codon:yes gene_type:complete
MNPDQIAAVRRVLDFAAPAIEEAFDRDGDGLTFAERRNHVIHDVRALMSWAKTLPTEER